MGKVVAVDFDGVIHDHLHPIKKMGAPMPEAIDTLQDLADHYKIIIHTVRANTSSGRKAVADWLEYFDIDYEQIAPKPVADYYIDDRAVKFRSWAQIRKELLDE